jgi:hypothetical protein
MSPDRKKDVFDPDQTVSIRRFNHEPIASLYMAQLQQAGIPAFIAYSHFNSMLPVGDSGIYLYVRLEDRDNALKLLNDIDEEARQEREQEHFREATHADIAYERDLNRPYGKIPWIFSLLVILLVVFMIVRAFLRVSVGFDFLPF